MLDYYKKLLKINNIPSFLEKYLVCPSLMRLKKVGYFCGMDYASRDIYDFSEYISRYDHSLTVALLIYKLTKYKLYTLAGLFHDVSTPCFSHVIDYMNNDYENQESTEEYTSNIINNDSYLKSCLKKDNINVSDIINFKKYHIVDSKRPCLCADRLDGIILTGIGWTKNITKKDIYNIVNDVILYNNENNDLEIGFKSISIAKKVMEINNSIDKECHSKEDNYMMILLAKITKLAIENNYISYSDLYKYNEDQIFDIFNGINNLLFKELLDEFKSIKKKDIKNINIPNIKQRKINPLVNGKRLV